MLNLKGSHVLSRPCRPSSEFSIQELIVIAKRLKKALKESPTGIAIAANQVLENGRIPSMFIYQDKVFLDPKYEDFFQQAAIVDEGCLSDPNRNHRVIRFPVVDVFYKELVYDRIHTRAAILHDLDAQVFQHETDHLNGKTIFKNSAS